MIKYTKKILILSPAKNAFSPARNDDLKGVLIIERTSGGVSASLRLYNFFENKNYKYILAVTDSVGNKYKISLSPNASNVYAFMLDTDINLGGKLTAIFVEINNGMANPLIWGAADSKATPEYDFSNLLSQFKSEISSESTSFAQSSNNSSVHSDDYDSEQDINNIIDDEFSKYDKDDVLFTSNNKDEEVIYKDDKSCEECVYKENFYGGVKAYSSEKVVSEQKKYIKDDKEPNSYGDVSNFFKIVSEQIDSLFKKYPPEKALESLLPNSKWVKIDYEGKGDYYAIGMLYQDEKLKYISYAVPSDFAGHEPDELKGVSQWFPLNTAEPNGKGYWIMYQDAESGECVVAS